MHIFPLEFLLFCFSCSARMLLLFCLFVYLLIPLRFDANAFIYLLLNSVYCTDVNKKKSPEKKTIPAVRDSFTSPSSSSIRIYLIEHCPVFY